MPGTAEANLRDARLPSSTATHELAYLADWLDWSDGEFRYCHRWIPCRQAREVKHVCVAIHGLGDHGGRFEELGEFLASHGIPLQAVDLIGHGRSPGKRGRIRSFDELLDEVHWSIREAHQVWRNATITLLGHSMGGNLALMYAAKRIESDEAENSEHSPAVIPIDIRARPCNLIAIAPMLRPYGRPLREDFFRAGCKLARWLPNWPMKLKTNPKMLTSDKSKHNRYIKDRLLHRTISIRLGIELLLSGKALIDAQTLPKIDSFLIHGTQDQLADIAASRELCDRCPQATLIELRDELHDPLNGYEADNVFQLIHRVCANQASGSRVVAAKRYAA